MKHGYLQNPLNIKLYVLYILKQLRAPIPFAELGEIAMCEDAVDYFEFADAAMGLKDTGHMAETLDESGLPCYSITPKGLDLVDVAERTLPYSVKTSAQRAVFLVVARMRREASIHTETVQRGDDLFVRCSLEDPYCTILSMELMVVTQQQATLLERRFRDHAEKIYNRVLDAMLDDYETPEEPDSVSPESES